MVYTWGNDKYPAQKYKSTIVYKDSYDTKAGINGKTKENQWYKNTFKQKFVGQEWNQSQKQEIRTSDAVDDYTKRQQIDQSTGTITYGTATNPANNTMNSTTPTFKINIESYDGSLKAEQEFSKGLNGKIDFTKRKNEYKNYVTSIDFGIALRPQQRLVLQKQIQQARILLANGFELAKIKRDNNGNMSDSPYVVYLEKSSGGRGQIKFEVDSEIIQGAKLDIIYKFIVANQSEKDYLNQIFYTYGRGYGDQKSDETTMPTLSAKQVIDYLDNNITISDDAIESKKWDILNKDKVGKMRTDTKLLQNTAAMQSFLANRNGIVITDKLSKNLIPGETNSIELNCYKLLSNTIDGLEINNDSEVIEIEKTGGSAVSTIPGNYIPFQSSGDEDDDDYSEEVIITKPTGIGYDYIFYVLLAISVLGILVFGIILIKKIVLKEQ